MVWWFVGCGEDPGAPPASTSSPGPHTAGDTGHSAAPDRPLTLLSLNLHCLKQDGTPFATLEERLDAIATFAVGADVEALAVQEACVAGGVDALELLRARLSALDGVEWTSAWALAHVGWEGTPDEAQEGVGLLARGDLLDVVEVVYVSPGQLRRVALAARLPRGPVLVSTHLDYGDALQREDQARQTATWALALADAVAGSPGEVIVAGDLNDVAGSATVLALPAMGFVDAARDLPAGRIDHVFVHRGASVRPLSAELVLTDPPVSDHPGVLVRLAPTVPEALVVTRLTAHVDVGFGHHLAVRGDSAPLSWGRGWWARPAAADRWELVLTELDGPFAFKTLVDDATWQAGPDVAGAAGAAVEVTPTF
jgi:endonuclease/exonuclease/phosphatase family metal-dependent hydrolase